MRVTPIVRGTISPAFNFWKRLLGFTSEIPCGILDGNVDETGEARVDPVARAVP